jgi:hypothetical protein
MNDLEGKEQALEGDRVEALRLILENEQGQPVTYNEALEVAEGLLCYFEVMADDTEQELVENEEQIEVEAWTSSQQPLF